MKIASLVPLGIDSNVIDLWRSVGQEELLTAPLRSTTNP